MTYDFSASYFVAAITNHSSPNNNTPNYIPFWGSIVGDNQRSSKSTFPLGAMAWVQEITVELNLGNVPIITCQLSPPFREGMEFLDAEIEYGRAELHVQVGYTGGNSEGGPILSPVFTGLLLEPSIAIGEDIQITLNAQGVGGFSTIRQAGTKTAQLNETRLDLIRRIAGSNKRALEVEVRKDDVPDDSATRLLLDEKIQWSQGGKSDNEALWELVNEAQGWMIYVSEAEKLGAPTKPKLRIMSRDRALGAPPLRTLRLYDFKDGTLFGGQCGEYPILQVSNPPVPVYFPGSMRALVMEEISDKNPGAPKPGPAFTATGAPAVPVAVEAESHVGELRKLSVHSVRRAFSDAAGDQGTISKAGAAAPAPSEAFTAADPATGDGGETLPGDPESASSMSRALMEFRRAGNMGVPLDIDTIGIPDIKPGEVVLVTGLGKRLSGHRWGVHTVRHQVGGAGFSTSIHVVSNTEEILRTGAQAARGKVNKEKLKETASACEGPTLSVSPKVLE